MRIRLSEWIRYYGKECQMQHNCKYITRNIIISVFKLIQLVQETSQSTIHEGCMIVSKVHMKLSIGGVFLKIL